MPSFSYFLLHFIKHSSSKQKPLLIFPQRKMKIFNWMHGYQFSSNVSLMTGDGSSGHTRRSGSPIGKAKAERDPLLEQDEHAVESWELEGILTIGTLALNPFKTINPLQDEEIEKNDGEAKQSYIDNYDPYYNNDEILPQDPQCDEIAMCEFHAHKQRDVEMRCNKEIEAINEEIAIEKTGKMGKRVTLLDLFLADESEGEVGGEAKPGDDYVEDGNESTEVMEMKMSTKKAIIYNKLSPDLGERKGFSSKAKKLQRFMTRMVKKKIHPDMEARLQKKIHSQISTKKAIVAANESVSLLPINQGIMV